MKEELIRAIQAHNKKSARSQQVEIGPSEIGGCQRKLWHRAHPQPGDVTNPNTLVLAAWMGTAIHAQIEKMFGKNKRYMVEKEVTADGITGHIDLIDTETNTIWDWKTTTKASLSMFPTKQQILQVHLYGYLARANGITVDKVGLIGIARDGNEEDVYEWVVTYDEETAKEALNRLSRIVDLEEPPAPEKDKAFCSKYCEYFGTCPSRTIESHGELIVDTAADDWAKIYLEANKQVKDWEQRADAAKAELVGISGTTVSGIRISWSEVSGRQTVDENAVEKALGFVPKKQGKGYSRLTVKP